MPYANLSAAFYARFGSYLDCNALIADQISAGAGSSELRQVASKITNVTDAWSGLVPSHDTRDLIHTQAFERLVEEVVKRAEAEWTAPDAPAWAGMTSWRIVFAQLVARADQAHRG